MKTSTLQTAELLDLLPEEDASMVNRLVKKLVLAWDPDFTKVTAQERKELDQADAEMKHGDYIKEDDFWSSLDN